VAVDENIGNQANNNDNDNVMMGQIDADADEYIEIMSKYSMWLLMRTSVIKLIIMIMTM